MQELKCFFEQVVRMSLTASVIIPIVLTVRIFLRKLPTSYFYYLWAVVGFRLCSPFSFSSKFSIFNLHLLKVSGQVHETVGTDSGISVMTDAVVWMWLFGIILLFIYGVYGWLKLRNMTKQAIWLRDNIYECDNIPSPFVSGIICPKIYIPFRLSKEDQKVILLHEQEHIRRKDYLIKWIAYLLLMIHWFNPLVWICYCFVNRDIEMSCDESVIKILGEDYKVMYSSLLLSFAINRRKSIFSPIAFGESEIERRVKKVLNYKKTKMSVAVMGVLAVLIVVAACMTNASKTVNNGQAALEKEMLVLREYNEEYETLLWEKEQELQEMREQLAETTQRYNEVTKILEEVEARNLMKAED